MSDFSRLRIHISTRIDVTDSEFEFFSSLIKVKQLKKRELFSEAGDSQRLAGFVNKGCLRTFYTDSKAVDHVLSISFEDWWVSDLRSFFTGDPAFYSIEALEECELFVLDFEKQESIFMKAPAFERYFRLLVQNAFIASQNRVMEEMTFTAEDRYTKLIEKYPTLELRVAQQHIASFLGITPEALSRIRKSMLMKQKKSS
ncbi:MAG: Crp/Fnr family transcriptional regulator [Flavobacteriales bacterium]|nr:Crp/Fnr family transcriptional regulator [Flavobacteriales bacterium]